MIKFFTSIQDFKKEASSIGEIENIDKVLELDFPFLDKQQKYALLNIPIYQDGRQQNLVLLSKKLVLVYSDFTLKVYEKHFKDVLKKPYGESTVISFLILKQVLKNYSREFERIRAKMNLLDLDPVLGEIENSGRELRRLTDRCEELVQMIIILKERDIEEFNTSLISFDYEILSAEARYWLERCRSHMYRISSLRTKSEMRSNRELNSTMHRLTIIITFLTITSIVVSVPGTIGAIFGIPALSDAYFEPHTNLLVLILIASTLLSIALGYVYWKSLSLVK